MNVNLAKRIRERQLQGLPVTALELQEAIRTLGTKRSNRFSLPDLRPDVRQKVNLTLMFNLGIAIGMKEANAHRS